MGVTVAWDDSTPPGNEALTNGDNRIREFKEGVAQRLGNGGHKWSLPINGGSSTDTEDGRHICGGELAATGAGTPLAGEFYIYAADGSTRILTIRDSTAATPSQVSAPTLVTEFANQRTLAIALAGNLGVQAGVYFENRAPSPQAITILGAKLVCTTAPAGTSLVVNIFRLASGYTDPNNGGTSIFTTPASDLVITATNKVGSETTSIVGAQSVLSTGDALRFEITTLSAAADIVVYLRVR